MQVVLDTAKAMDKPLKPNDRQIMSPLIQNIIRFAVIMAIQILLLNTVELQNVTAVWGVSLFKPFFYLFNPF